MKRIVSAVIKFYIKHLSKVKPPCCRFYPTCSEYTLQAVQNKGCLSGLCLGFCRILRCNPFFKSGYNPVKE